jgi:hypothetical protein
MAGWEMDSDFSIHALILSKSFAALRLMPFAFHLLPVLVGGQSGWGAADNMLPCSEPTARGAVRHGTGEGECHLEEYVIMRA